MIRARTLPLTWIGYSTCSATSSAGSADRERPVRQRLRVTQPLPHLLAMCGASGAVINTSASATDRGTGAPDLVRWLVSTISLAIAVL